MGAAILERDARAGHEVLDGARDEHLAGAGLRRDARADVDGDPAELVRRSARTRPCAGRRGSRGRAARTASAIARAHRIARAGPSKVARKPSPAVSTSRPRKRASCAPHERVVALEQLAPARGRRARAAVSVEPTMSVNITVASTRSGSCAVTRRRVRNSSISSRTRRRRRRHGRWSSPGSSTNARPGCARPCSAPARRRRRGRRVRCRTSVGTRIAGRTCADVDLDVHARSSALRRPGAGALRARSRASAATASASPPARSAIRSTSARPAADAPILLDRAQRSRAPSAPTDSPAHAVTARSPP